MSNIHLIYIYSDGETVTHLLKASLGTGILAMPVAFMYSGLALGIFATVLTALICTHCSYILVWQTNNRLSVFMPRARDIVVSKMFGSVPQFTHRR